VLRVSHKKTEVIITIIEQREEERDGLEAKGTTTRLVTLVRYTL